MFSLVFITISRIHQFLPIGALHPAMVLVFLAALYTLMNPSSLNRSAMKSWSAKIMIALGLMACLSVPFGISIGGAGSFVLFEYSKVIILGLLVLLAMRDARDLAFLTWGYVVACGMLAVLAVLFIGISKHQGLAGYDANDVSLVVLVGLPLSLMMFQASTGTRKLISLAVVIGIAATLAMSRSRGGFVGLVVVGATLLVVLKRVPLWKRIAFVVVLGGGLVLTAPGNYWETMQTMLHPTQDYNWSSSYGRKEVYSRGLGYMASHPFTGLGAGNFGRAEGTLSNVVSKYNDTQRGQIKWSAAHNSFIQAGAEMGYPGLILFCILVFGGLWRTIRLRRRLPPSWAEGDAEERFLYYAALYLPVSFVAFASAGFFLSFAYRDPIYLLAAFVGGLYISVDARVRKIRAAQAERVRLAPGRRRDSRGRAQRVTRGRGNVRRRG